MEHRQGAPVRHPLRGPPRPGLLGATHGTTGVTLLALSGALRFNGRPDTAYVHKGRTAPYDGDTSTSGRAASSALTMPWTGGVPHAPDTASGRSCTGASACTGRAARALSLDRIVRLKTAALDRRRHDREDVAGYLKFTGPGHTAGFMYGWTGQCLKLAWCDARIGLEHGETWRVERCRRAVNFYLDGSTVTAAPASD